MFLNEDANSEIDPSLVKIRVQLDIQKQTLLHMFVACIIFIMLKKIFGKKMSSPSSNNKRELPMYNGWPKLLSCKECPSHFEPSEVKSGDEMPSGSESEGNLELDTTSDTSQDIDKANNLPSERDDDHLLASKSENIFEEPILCEQKEALAITVLEQQQRQRRLFNRLSHDQKCVIIMQGELRATLIENKRLEDQAKTLEEELKRICSQVKESKSAETAILEKKIKSKYPNLWKKYQNCKIRKEALEVIKHTRDTKAVLSDFETLLKLKYMELYTMEVESGSAIFKGKKAARKKIVAKRHTPTPQPDFLLRLSDSSDNMPNKTKGGANVRDNSSETSALDALANACTSQVPKVQNTPV